MKAILYVNYLEIKRERLAAQNEPESLQYTESASRRSNRKPAAQALITAACLLKGSESS